MEEKILVTNGFKLFKQIQDVDSKNILSKIYEENFKNPRYQTLFNKIDFNLNQKMYKKLVSLLKGNMFFLYNFGGAKCTLDSNFKIDGLYICYIHRKYPGKFIPLINLNVFEDLVNKEKKYIKNTDDKLIKKEKKKIAQISQHESIII